LPHDVEEATRLRLAETQARQSLERIREDLGHVRARDVPVARAVGVTEGQAL
jgi:hypothetical protein